ncbi:MAG: DUF2281 domain-containing protein [Spirochaetaceae bacterium]|nr:DUF2281 domain-containing protein [Spirochaetaceae bacterium]
MSLDALQRKLNSFPEEYFEEINAFFDLLSYKVTAISSGKQKNMQKVIPGLAAGKWKYPNDINAYDDEVADMFEGYV